MDRAFLFQFMADAVLLVHVGVVVFVLVGLLLIVAGNLRGWEWVNRPALRLAHLAAIGVVVAQAWLGQTCPLTVLEMRLRVQARGSVYEGGFIQHWLQQLLYYEAPAWVFTLAYTAFGLMVALAWWRFPPRWRAARAAARASGQA